VRFEFGFYDDLASLASDIKARVNFFKQQLELVFVRLEVKRDTGRFSINVEAGNMATNETCFRIDIGAKVGTKNVVSGAKHSGERTGSIENEAQHQAREEE